MDKEKYLKEISTNTLDTINNSIDEMQTIITIYEQGFKQMEQGAELVGLAMDLMGSIAKQNKSLNNIIVATNKEFDLGEGNTFASYSDEEIYEQSIKAYRLRKEIEKKFTPEFTEHFLDSFLEKLHISKEKNEYVKELFKKL